MANETKASALSIELWGRQTNFLEENLMLKFSRLRQGYGGQAISNFKKNSNSKTKNQMQNPAASRQRNYGANSKIGQYARNQFGPGGSPIGKVDADDDESPDKPLADDPAENSKPKVFG